MLRNPLTVSWSTGTGVLLSSRMAGSVLLVLIIYIPGFP